MKKIQHFILLILFITGCNSSLTKEQVKQPEEKQDWLKLFNGTDLKGWTPKVAYAAVGENVLDVFRVENGMLRIDYSNYERFDNQYGHLFYKDKFSDFILRVEYRFVGELLPDAPFWCYRNSGVMFHSQSPESMPIDMYWPVSVEAQLLGSTDTLNQVTANVCTPGTTVHFKGAFSDEHCISANTKFYQDGAWVKLDIIVHGSKQIYHVIEDDTVLAYSNPQVGGYLLPEDYPISKGTLLSNGYIALQAEGQPIDFRKVELFDLSK